MNPSYKLTKKAATAREEARKVFTPSEVDRIVESAHADRSRTFLDFCTAEQREAFGTFFGVFPINARVSFAKAFVILADFSDIHRTK